MERRQILLNFVVAPCRLLPIRCIGDAGIIGLGLAVIHGFLLGIDRGLLLLASFYEIGYDESDDHARRRDNADPLGTYCFFLLAEQVVRFMLGLGKYALGRFYLEYSRLTHHFI